VIAKRIERIDVEAALVGGLETFVHLQVENLKPQSLRFANFTLIRGDFDFEFRHFFEKRNTRLFIVKLTRSQLKDERFVSGRLQAHWNRSISPNKERVTLSRCEGSRRKANLGRNWACG